MIRLHQVKPEPIPESFIQQSTVWAADFTLEKGKKYLVTAPSGKGKSTFLHAIYGLRKDFSGDIFINDQSILTFDLKKWATIRQKNLSIVFQDLRLFLPLNGWENIQLKNQLTQHKSEEEILAMADKLGVLPILKQQCGTMSYGQRQRIALLRALCQPFDYLLLDEPFSHLDEANIKNACQLFEQEIKQQQAGMLLVSLGDAYRFEYYQTFDL